MSGKHGFAGMEKEKLRELSSLGGKAAQACGRGHRFSSEEAREAGRKGGLSSGKKKREQAQ